MFFVIRLTTRIQLCTLYPQLSGLTGRAAADSEGTEDFANARAAVGRLFGPCRWPAGVGSACAADGQMFDAVDSAGARRPGVDVPGDLPT